MKVAPLPGVRRDVDGAAVGLGDRARDVEAEAGAGLRAAARGATELLEDQPLVVDRDARPVVGDRDDDRAVQLPHVDVDRGAGRRVLDRVVDQVAHDLAEPPGVAADERNLADHRVQRHLVLADGGRRDRVADERGEIDVREAVRERPGLDPRRVEHVADQGREPRRLVADQCEERLALLGGQLAPALLQRPRRADHRRHRASQLMRDERDEVGAHHRQALQLLDRAALALVGADVLHRRGDEAAEQAHQLDLVLRERVALVAADRDEPDRAAADVERRGDARVDPERPQPRLLGVFGARSRSRLTIVWPRGDDVGEQAALERQHRSGRHHLVGERAGGRDHASRAFVGEHDRHALERHERAQLADERARGLVEVERRAERPRTAVGCVEQVGAAAQLVAQRLGLLDPALHVAALGLDAVDEPADEQRHHEAREDLEDEEVDPEVAVHGRGAPLLEPACDRDRGDGSQDAAAHAVAHGAGENRDQQQLAGRGAGLEREEQDEARDDQEVERHRERRQAHEHRRGG